MLALERGAWVRASPPQARPSPCPVVGGRGLPLAQALERGAFSAHLPQLLVFQAPHRGLCQVWNGGGREEMGMGALILLFLQGPPPQAPPTWKSLPAFSFLLTVPAQPPPLAGGASPRSALSSLGYSARSP